MSKYVFNSAERYALWKLYGYKCFWCEIPLRIFDVTVDHLIPERLLTSKKEYEEVKEKYSLPDSFEINDFCNWVPCHGNCNNKKGKKTFAGSPAFLIILEKVISKSTAIKAFYEKLIYTSRKDKEIGDVLTSLEKGTMTDTDLMILLTRTKYKELNYEEKEEKFKELIPKGYKLIDIDDYGHGIIYNGRIGGMIPLNPDPHHSWRCPHCWEYGPWNGTICMNCGQKSVELD